MNADLRAFLQRCKAQGDADLHAACHRWVQLAFGGTNPLTPASQLELSQLLFEHGNRPLTEYDPL